MLPYITSLPSSLVVSCSPSLKTVGPKSQSLSLAVNVIELINLYMQVGCSPSTLHIYSLTFSTVPQPTCPRSCPRHCQISAPLPKIMSLQIQFLDLLPIRPTTFFFLFFICSLLTSLTSLWLQFHDLSALSLPCCYLSWFHPFFFSSNSPFKPKFLYQCFQERLEETTIWSILLSL